MVSSAARAASVLVASVALFAGLVSTASSGQEETRHCHAEKNGLILEGSTRIFYESHSPSRWDLKRERYRIGPDNYSGDKNNVNVKVVLGNGNYWPGDSDDTWKSPDNLPSDDEWHHLRYFDLHPVKGESRVHSHVIFDQPFGDPDCDVDIYL